MVLLVNLQHQVQKGFWCLHILQWKVSQRAERLLKFVLDC